MDHLIGDTMVAGPGDWAVREPDGDRWWSVRDDVFRAGHEHVEGSLWRRTGFVRARQAHDRVVIDTLEGRALAAAGDWVVQSADGHSWPVGPDEFAHAGIRARDFGRPGTALVRRRAAPDRS